MSAITPIPGNPALAPGLAPAGAPRQRPTQGEVKQGEVKRGEVKQREIKQGEIKQGEGQFLLNPPFAEVLRKAAGSEPLSFSRHALERVQRRGIELDPSTLARLHEGVGRAAGKGSRDSVVLVDGTAFVVSVPNRTVVTAVGAQHMREHVFTNVDSAVIA